MHLLVFFIQFSYSWIACTVMTKLQVTIIDCIESIRCADNTYRLLITGIRNYKLKLPLQTYFDRQPPETLGTCSPGDPLPFGPNSKFRRCS